jgi:hypothetical protein
MSGIAAPGALRMDVIGQTKNFPCARWIRFEQVFNPDVKAAEDISLTYRNASAAIEDECAFILDRRIEEEAKRRGISRQDLKRLWNEAEKQGRTLFGSERDPGVLLLMLAPVGRRA